MSKAVHRFANGSQRGITPWGNYATMVLDSLDDCTFWFANEYVPETRLYSWAATIAAVRFDDCVPPVTLSGSEVKVRKTPG